MAFVPTPLMQHSGSYKPATSPSPERNVMPDKETTLEFDVVAVTHEKSQSGDRLFIVGKQTAGLSITTSFRDSLCCIVLGQLAAEKWQGKLKQGDYIIAKGVRSGAHPFQFGIQIIPSFNAVEIERGFQSLGNEPVD